MNTPNGRRTLEAVLRALISTSEEYQARSLSSEVIREKAVAAISAAGDGATTVDDLATWAEMHFNVHPRGGGDIARRRYRSSAVADE